MKYSIFTVANKSYYPFVQILVNSISKNCSNVDKIYIADCGLEKYAKYLQENEKVIILKTDTNNQYRGMNSDGWLRTTEQKTKKIKDLLSFVNFGDQSLILIDSDVCVLKDFSELIDQQYDMQVTSMKNQHYRRDGIFLRQIAAFLIFNNQEKSIEFLDYWIDIMKNFEKDKNVVRPYETPALNSLLRKSGESKLFNVGDLSELKVCADQEVGDDTYSVHFKSGGRCSELKYRKHTLSENFSERIQCILNTSKSDINFGKYLNDQYYSEWIEEIGNEEA